MKNKIYLISLFSLLLVASIFMISATTNIVTPAISQIYSGTGILNATNLTLPNMLNCTWTAGSVSTANTSVSLGTFTNASANAGSINGTFDSTTLEDASDYVFSVICRNDTANGTGSMIGITIDNTVPTAPSLSPSTDTTITSATTQTFTGTVNNARTTGCTYTIYRYGSSGDTASASGTGTYSATSCTFTKAFSTSADNGNYVWTIIATDGKNTTSSSSINFNVQITPGNGGVATDQSGNIITSSTTQDSSGMNFIWIILVIIVIVGIVYYIYK